MAKTATKRRGRPPKKRPPAETVVEPEKHLALETCGKQWPDLSKQFEVQLRSAVADCRGRPLTTAKRKIVVTFELKPDDGDVIINAQSKVAFPPSRMEPVGIKVGPRNQLMLDFNRNSDVDLLEDEGEQTPLEPAAVDDDWPDDV